jgi:hypothetical protein
MRESPMSHNVQALSVIRVGERSVDAHQVMLPASLVLDQTMFFVVVRRRTGRQAIVSRQKPDSLIQWHQIPTSQ